MIALEGYAGFIIMWLNGNLKVPNLGQVLKLSSGGIMCSIQYIWLLSQIITVHLDYFLFKQDWEVTEYLGIFTLFLC